MRAVVAALLLAGCRPDVAADNVIPGADPHAGAATIAAFGCPACHVVPGVAGPRGRVGPNLSGFGGRAMIAGTLPNRPDQLVRWLLDPPAIAPGTAMPDLGLSPQQARDVAAYLYTLR